MNVDRVQLINFAQTAMVASGADKRVALQKAEILVWCDQVGRDTQGLWRLPMIVKRLKAGLHPTPPDPLKFETVAPSLCRLNGHAGLGYYIASSSMKQAIAIASSQGLGCVAVYNGSHLGAAAYYVKQAADAGMIGLCFSNSIPKVIPPEGDKAVWGTNPLAVGFPRKNGEHVLIDMATSTISGSSITKAQQVQKLDNIKLPESTDEFITKSNLPPSGNIEISPMGGVKGFALGFAVEVLSAILTGSGVTHQLRSMHNDFDGPANNGHLMIALSIEPLMPLELFYQRLEGLVTEVHASGEEGKVRIPGEIRWKKYKDSLKYGVLIDSHLQASLEQLAEELKINFPW